MGGACLVIPTSRLPNGVDEASKVVLHPVVLLDTIFQIEAAAINMEGNVVTQVQTTGSVDDIACRGRLVTAYWK